MWSIIVVMLSFIFISWDSTCLKHSGMTRRKSSQRAFETHSDKVELLEKVPMFVG